MEEPILACSGLAVGYGGRTVASGIGCAVASGQCVCVVGENGAGKSTLLRTLLGLQPALAGEIRRGGDVRPGDIGYLPQQNPVQGDFPATAREVALSGVQAARGLRPFFRAADRRARARGRARALLRDVGRLDGAPRKSGEGRLRMTAAFDTLRQYLAFPFVQNALMAGLLIALAAALLGVTLVLRRLSYIGDGLSHVAFGTMAVAGALEFADRLSLSIPVTAACAVALLRSGRGSRVRGDAALAMLSVGAMGLGYLLMNLFPGSSNVAGDVCSTLFGSTSILTLSPGDVRLCAALSLLVAAFFALFRHRVFEVVFDPGFARSCGTRTALWETALAVLSAVVIVIAMRLVGTLLVSALLVFPAVGAMRVGRSFLAVLLVAAATGVSCALVGILASILAGTPVGSTIVAADILAFLLLSLLGRLRR